MSRFLELNSDTLLLTANNRLARVFTAEHNTQQIAAGKTAWPAANILPLNAWLHQCSHDVIDASLENNIPRFLSTTQERVLWERIVRASLLTLPGQMDAAAMAKLAQDAWQLQHAWRIAQADALQQSLDAQMYAQWSQTYASRCTEENWLDQARLPDYIAGYINQKIFPVPKNILVAGFETVSPQTRALFSALVDAGTKVTEIQPPDIESQCLRFAAASPVEEIRSAARWARAKLLVNAEARIGIVVPGLAAKRNLLQREFDEALAPFALLPGEPPAHRPYNISLGLPLAHYPLIATAFDLLGIKQYSMEMEKWSALINSPYLSGAANEQAKRALCDAALRHTREFTLPLNAVLDFAANASRPHHCPQLADSLQALQTALNELPRSASPREWAKQFSRCLALTGWPDGRVLSSEEFQMVQAWRELLDQFISTEAIATKLDFNQALSALRRIANDALFQPESHHEPVQILGVYEALNLSFDHVWLLGFDDSSWPMPVRPNALLPLALQIRAGVPQASSDGALAFARQATGLLLRAAPEVIVSHGLHDNDEALRPSTLIAHIPLLEPDIFLSETTASLYAHMRQTAVTEKLTNDYRAPKISSTHFRGGTSLFKYQAACPFRAYAQIRLNAQEWPTPRIGLDGSERGQILHRALEFLWQQLQDQQTLLSLPENDLDTLVKKSAIDALQQWESYAILRLPKRLKAMEAHRLSALIHTWLAIEKKRTPFRIASVENKTLLAIGGITVDIRRDRMDTLADGTVMVMDYKSGDPGKSPWDDDHRPDEPQLPLYALAGEENVSALAFAKIKTGETKLIALASVDLMQDEKSGEWSITETRELSGDEVALTMNEQLARWRSELTQLAENFREGDARVDPKKSNETCQQCHLASLCRKDELQRVFPVEINDDE